MPEADEKASADANDFGPGPIGPLVSLSLSVDEILQIRLCLWKLHDVVSSRKVAVSEEIEWLIDETARMFDKKTAAQFKLTEEAIQSMRDDGEPMDGVPK